MSRIITEYTGRVRHETSQDGESIEKIMIGNNKILHGIWSILERHNGKMICLSIEELSANTEIIDKTAIEFRTEVKKDE